MKTGDNMCFNKYNSANWKVVAELNCTKKIIAIKVPKEGYAHLGGFFYLLCFLDQIAIPLKFFQQYSSCRVLCVSEISIPFD